MYQRPEIFELGDADELTLWRPFGNWPDGVEDRLIFTPAFSETLDSEETERQ